MRIKLRKWLNLLLKTIGVGVITSVIVATGYYFGMKKGAELEYEDAREKVLSVCSKGGVILEITHGQEIHLYYCVYGGPLIPEANKLTKKQEEQFKA